MSDPHPASLGTLGRRVRDARTQVSERRSGLVGHSGHIEFAHAQRDLWQALEAYVDGLEHEGLPVPRTIRSALQLHRVLFSRM